MKKYLLDCGHISRQKICGSLSFFQIFLYFVKFWQNTKILSDFCTHETHNFVFLFMGNRQSTKKILKMKAICCEDVFSYPNHFCISKTGKDISIQRSKNYDNWKSNRLASKVSNSHFKAQLIQNFVTLLHFEK